MRPVIVACALLGGCATLAPDGGVERASELARERTGVDAAIPRAEADEETVRARVEALLAQPLTADAAVEIALLNHAGLRAKVAELAAADAERAQAGRLANPSFSFSSKRNAEVKSIERALMVNVLSLVTLPLNQKLANRRVENAQLRLAADAVALAAEARRAWVRAVAAGQQLAYYEQAHDAASAASELAARMRAVGNFSQLARMREQSFAADTAAARARARHAASTARERLARTLGLWGSETAVQLPPRLPDLPASARSFTDAERMAIERRLDVAAAKRNAEATAEAFELTRVTRVVNVLHAGYVNEGETGDARKDGYEVEIELPLFDFGDAKYKRAEAAYMAAIARTREAAINARSEVRERYATYRTAYDLARHYRDEVVPLRKAISDEMLLRYNGMQIGVFELLADARAQIASVSVAIEATRDFWLADAQLHQALVGGPVEGGVTMAPTATSGSARSDGH